MGKDPSSGKRPRPRVAVDHSPRYNTKSGQYPGKSSTKSPTGSRPRPKVAKDTPVSPGAPARPSYPKKTKMPTPKQKWGTRGGGKPHGGK